MKINPVSPPNVVQTYQKNKITVAASGNLQSNLDEVQFSQQALSFSKTLAATKDQFNERTPIEKMHIADIAAQVRANSYQVDGQKVAEKMIRAIISTDPA